MRRTAALIVARATKQNTPRLSSTGCRGSASLWSLVHVHMPPADCKRWNRFHGTETKKAATRRRRRTRNAPPLHGASLDHSDSGAAEPARGGRPIAVKDRVVFVAAAQALLDKVEIAIAPMQKCNDVFVVTRFPKGTSDDAKHGDRLSIELQPGDGTYSLQADEEAFTVTLASPISGTFTYVLSEASKTFLGMDDGHILEGMLVRDLIRQCNGMPQF